MSPPRISHAFHSEPFRWTRFRQTISATRLALDRLPLDRPPPDYPRFRFFFPSPAADVVLSSLSGWSSRGLVASSRRPHFHEQPLRERERQEIMTFAEGKGEKTRICWPSREIFGSPTLGTSHPSDPNFFWVRAECPWWSGGAGGVQNCGAGLCGGCVFFVLSVCLFLCRVPCFFLLWRFLSAPWGRALNAGAGRSMQDRQLGSTLECRAVRPNAGLCAPCRIAGSKQGNTLECRAVRSMQDRQLKAGQYAQCTG